MTTPNRPIGAGLAGGGLWPAHVPRPQAPGTPAQVSRPAPAGPSKVEEVASLRLPWHGVQWTLIYVGLLGYIFTITTYRLPIGDVSMVVALFGLLIQKEKFRVPPLLVGLGLFLAWCIVGYAVTDEPTLVWTRLQIVLKLWLIALVAANALRTRAQLRFFVVFWLACFALYPVRGAIFNYYLYHETVVGRAAWNYIFSNPNDLAAYCILMLSLAAGLLSLEKRGPVKWATIAGLAVVPFVILLTKSRGAFLGFAGFSLLAVMGQRKRGKAIIVAAVVATLVISLAPSGVLDRVRGIKKIQGAEAQGLQEADREGSAFQRYEIWKVARTMIGDHPIVGVGLGAYPAYHAKYALRSQFDPTAQGFRDTHSTYLNLTAETGFIGMLLYFVSYITTLVQIDKVRRRAKKLLPATSQALYVYEVGTMGFFIAALFGSMAHVSFLVLHVIVTWSLAEMTKKELAALRTQPSWNDGRVGSGGPIASAGV